MSKYHRVILVGMIFLLGLGRVMELVYLWVDKYKNIENEGFNFSPKFECSYDGENLTITENKNYVNIFPDNINVTAIVGENGSGKSSIFEIISTFSYQDSLDKKSFLVFFNGKSFEFKQSSCLSKLTFKIVNKTKYKHGDSNMSRTIDTLYFGNELSTIFNNTKMKQIESYHGEINAFKDDKYDLHNQKYITYQQEKVIKFEIFNKRFQFILNKNKNILNKLDNALIFDSYKYELHFYEMISVIAGDKNFDKLIGEKNLGRSSIFETSLLSPPNADKILYKLIILFRLNQYKENIETIIEEIKDDFQRKDFDENTFVKISEYLDKYDKQNKIYSKQNIEKILHKYEYKGNEIWIEKDLIPINNSLEIKNSLLEVLNRNNIIRVDFLNSLDDNYNYFSLSSGERNYIEIFVTYIYHLIIRNENKSNQKFIFLLDEMDLGLHPNWQKRLIKDMLFFIKEYFNHPIQLILTSHSPFLLSDLPKENVIFLKKGKQVDVDINPFGANIHTLLSHGFFMEGGLMGEFAKGKIEEIKKFYDENKDLKKEYINFNAQKIDYKVKKERFNHIQSIIGEPFLKTIIKNYLDELDILFYGKKQFLNNEILRFQELQKNLDD